MGRFFSRSEIVTLNQVISFTIRIGQFDSDLWIGILSALDSKDNLKFQIRHYIQVTVLKLNRIVAEKEGILILPFEEQY
ncbi:hypothetical protein CEXT_474001 [Caerostris extrusa]|uniref:Uncharacterized protein n=1 Tax=Caerostris extrusa TaxID=172846 RepID=A0AAV4WHD7_CAEEX|nr:hypothetical protein CEXT_474001 [Caerostris extrusa]